MSATARAAGDPAEDRPGRRTPPPPGADPRPLPEARRGPVPGPDSGLRRSGETASSPRPRARATGGTTRTAAPAAPRRAHTAPVRTGSLRSRTAARPAQAPLAAPRTSSGSPSSRLLTAVGAHRAPFVLLVVTLLVATTLGLLFLNTAIAVNSLKATQLAAANEDRVQEVQRLEQQVIAGGTPAEVAREAREAGLVPAGPAAYLVVGEDGGVTLRGQAVPAEEPEPSEVPALPPPPVAGGGD